MVIENDGMQHQVQGLHPEKSAKTYGNSHDKHILIPQQLSQMTRHVGDVGTPRFGRKRNFITRTNRLWDKGIIPYRIYNMSSSATTVIHSAIKQFDDLTCVRWVPETSIGQYNLNHQVVVYFINEQGCWSYVGNVDKYVDNDNIQPVSLEENGCVSRSTAIHEMLHAMGGQHEQSRTDRDKYVEIVWANVKGGHSNINMKKMSTQDNHPYDAESSMQYALYSFSINGEKTILFKDKRLEFLADSATGLEFYDIADITTAYKCADHCTNPPICENAGFVNFQCQCFCPRDLSGATCTTIVSNAAANSAGCGGLVTLGHGEVKYIQSPNYGTSNYPQGLKCTWLIKGGTGSIVRASVEYMDVAAGKACEHWIEYRYNLLGQDGPKRCGTNFNAGQEIWDSSLDEFSNAMIINFNSEVSAATRTGFRIKLTTIGTGCVNNPCMYGTCQSPAGSNTYTCTCNNGVTGTNCDVLTASASISCSFEFGEICFLDQDTNDNFDWDFSSSSTPSSNTGPSFAHDGYMFAFIEASLPRIQGDKAVLVNNVLQIPRAVRCLSFWYHMYGGSVGDLNVYTEGQGVAKSKAFTKSGNQGNNWVKAEVDIPAMNNLKVYFEGVRGSDWGGDIGLDDVLLAPGTCGQSTNAPAPPAPPSSTLSPSTSATNPPTNPPTNQPAPTVNPGTVQTCSFEQGASCFMVESSGDDFDWTYKTGSTPSSGTGPRQAFEGSRYKYIEVSSPRKNYEKATLVSSVYLTEPSYCLTFAYHMYGSPDMGSLTIEAGDTPLAGTIVFSESGNQGDQWKQGVVDISGAPNMKLYITANKATSWQGDIAIDDIRLHNTACSTGTVQTCNFEQGTSCFMVESSDDDFDWTFKTGRTPSSGTGPQQAFEGSRYKYIEVSSPRMNYAKATLVSSMDLIEPSYCLTFAYHMYGASNMGSLTIETGATRIAGNQVFFESGNQGDQWNHGVVDINGAPNMKLFITASKTTTWQGDIAIDDLRLHNTACNAITNQIQACNFETKQDCVFENDGTAGTYDWVVISGSTPSSNTGPSGAFEGSQYIYMETSSPRVAGDQFVLTSSKSSLGNTPYCLQFHYHMYGSAVGSLSVKYGNRGGVPVEVWKKDGNQGDKWQLAQVDLSATYSDLVISIVGTRGTSWTGDIALDALSLEQGSCSLSQNSYSCDFEDGQSCVFENGQNDDFDWTRKTGPTSSVGTGPDGAFTGSHYMYIEVSSPVASYSDAVLTTVNTILPLNQWCLSFAYHMKGNPGNLTVRAGPRQSQTSEIWTKSGNQGNNWQTVDVNIPAHADPLIEIWGSKGQSYQGDIAIDDLKLSPNTCGGAGR